MEVGDRLGRRSFLTSSPEWIADMRGRVRVRLGLCHLIRLQHMYSFVVEEREVDRGLLVRVYNINILRCVVYLSPWMGNERAIEVV